MASSAASERPARRPREGGQATVELALCMPIVAMLLLLVVQVGVVVAEQLLVQHAAREAARVAAVAAAPEPAARAVVRSILRDARVATAVAGPWVTVTVGITEHTDVALIGRMLGDVHLVARATMPREPP